MPKANELLQSFVGSAFIHEINPANNAIASSGVITPASFTRQENNAVHPANANAEMRRNPLW